MGGFNDIFPRHRQRHYDQIRFRGMLQKILSESQVSVGFVLNGQQFRLRYSSWNGSLGSKLIQ